MAAAIGTDPMPFFYGFHRFVLRQSITKYDQYRAYGLKSKLDKGSSNRPKVLLFRRRTTWSCYSNRTRIANLYAPGFKARSKRPNSARFH